MNSLAQSTKQNTMTPSSSTSCFLVQRKCACGGSSKLGGQCSECEKKKLVGGNVPLIQRKLEISQPNDKYEQEAERVADEVSRMPGPNTLRQVRPEKEVKTIQRKPIARRISPLVQRQESDGKPKSNEEKAKEALEKTGEAFLETAPGKAIVKKGKEVATTLPGSVIAGAAAVGAVTALVATNKELPIQAPAIPLDKLHPGLSMKITVEGPLQSPTKAMISFSGKFGLPKRARRKNPPKTESEKLREQNARMRREQFEFRESLKTPEEKARDQEMLNSFILQGMNDPTNPLFIPGLKPQEDVPAIEKKKEEPPIQRKEANSSHDVVTDTTMVREVTKSTGKPLDSTTRGFMEQQFGHDFSQVRMHTGDAAERSAHAVNANAYTVGNNIVFGAGQFSPRTNEGRRLLAHELTHVVQQSKGKGSDGLCVQRDVIDDVRENLSYGLFDWAVTDSEAMDSLALLGTIDPVVLAAEISKLESKYITRLIDNLPDAAKTGDVYKRVITAIGASGVAGHVTEKLSYGLFDWAITDAEVTQVFNVFVNLSPADQEQLLADLNASGFLERLIDNSTGAHHSLYIRPWVGSLTPGRLTPQQRTILRVMASETSDSAIETLKLLLETRFDVTVGPTTKVGETPADWTASNMRSAYLVLDQLPDAHVARNKELLALGQFTEASRQVGDKTRIKAGRYSPALNEFALNTEASGDLSDTIRHETAHAVDREMGWSVGPEPAKHSRGGWKTYGNHRTCATEMVDDSNGGIKSEINAVERTDVIVQMTTAMGNRSVSTLEQDIRNLPWFNGLTNDKKNSVLADKSLDALGTGLATPWFDATDGGEHLGNHVYQESYTPTWVRYRHEARSRFISDYQFRDEGEWFAEAYDLYYTPDSRGRGAKMNDVDPNTKTYFDNFVHTRAATR